MKADSAGTDDEPIVCAVRSAAPTWPPMTDPTIRTTVFMPVAIPISRASTLSAIRATIVAKAAPTPRPSSALESTTCQGSSWANASRRAANATIVIPAASGHFGPTRRPTSPATGPEKSIASELGSR